MRSDYLQKWDRVSVLIKLAICTLNAYGNAQANGFCIIGFLQLEINLFSFVFFIFFFLQLLYWIPDLFRESLGG